MLELQTESNLLTRRTFLKKAGKLYLGLMTAGMMTGAYSFKAERFWYQIKEIQLKLKNLPKAFHGWKIVQFSDIHLGFHYGPQDLKTVIKQINDLNPDIIFFTGDLIQNAYPNPELAIPLLKELKMPRGGKWAVIGNHDYSSKNNVIQVFGRSGFTFLENNHDFIETEGQRLYVAGTDDVLYGLPDMEKAVADLSKDDCVLLLAHEPDFADESSKYPISAQFSGHSHGGQVRLPFIGPLIRNYLAVHYVDGLYHVGIGTSQLAVRFYCRPEITVFHLS